MLINNVSCIILSIYIKYYEEYKSQNVKMDEYYKLREKAIYCGIITTIAGGIYYLYDK